MNIRFYLNSNWERSRIVHADDKYFGQQRVSDADGPRPYVSSTSEAFARDFCETYLYFISSISIMGYLPTIPQRTRGQYLFGKASCRLEAPPLSARPTYEFHVVSRRHFDSDADPSLKDALGLVDRLRRGTIAPTVSWDEPQITKKERQTRKHLREHTRPRFRLGHRRAAV